MKTTIALLFFIATAATAQPDKWAMPRDSSAEIQFHPSELLFRIVNEKPHGEVRWYDRNDSLIIESTMSIDSTVTAIFNYLVERYDGRLRELKDSLWTCSHRPPATKKKGGRK